MENKKDIIRKVISDYELAFSKIILYCITELPFPLGISKTIAVLRGKKNTFAINNKLNQLETFSLLSGLTKDQLNITISMLIESGLIIIQYVSKYENMPVLKITAKGLNYLDGKEEVQISVIDSIIDKTVPELNDEEKIIFLKLKDLRRKLSEKADLPHFTICGDNVLRNICLKKPKDENELLSISGIGQKFVDKYGKLFLEIISNP
jgi:ATP-dependent DNA helicase RecQ